MAIKLQQVSHWNLNLLTQDEICLPERFRYINETLSTEN